MDPMDDNAINNLKDALKFSPNNIPLKQHLAEILLKANKLDEAEVEYSELLKLSPNNKFKIGLAKTFTGAGGAIFIIRGQTACQKQLSRANGRGMCR